MGLLLHGVIDHEKMRAMRKALGLRQDQAAMRAGMARKQAWYVVESGKKTNVTMATLYAIARALECEPADLLTPLTKRGGKKS